MEEPTPPIQGMRDVDWPPTYSTVNIVFPLQVGGDTGDTRYLALAYWLLPRVPTIGEEVSVIGRRVRVESVLWGSDGKVSVRLVEARVRADATEELEREGWVVQPWEDEPPGAWFIDDAIST